ncbi:MAG: glycosyltransferase family 4 protein [Legionellaceae bacterium]|nr:glycosyltransferase family 4 protein [Legionellaceae bacterium]
MKKKLLFILNEPTYFISHRLPIAIAAKKEGYEVHVATGAPSALPRILDEGFTYHAIPLSRSGRNVFMEVYSIFAIYRLMKKLNPGITHLVTIKPVIYGSIAARFAKVPAVVAAVSGLGYAFIDNYFEARLLRKVVSHLYRQAFRHKNLKVIFQNTDDLDTLIQIGAVDERQSVLIKGSGVDLNHYKYTEEPTSRPFIIVMASRLLRDKGVYEYVAAAKLLREKGIDAKFLLAGQIDKGNPSSISQQQLEKLSNGKYIEHIGHQDTHLLFQQVHLVVLPSYREGLPRVLCEAAASGRAVITTDVPGCRAAVIPDKTAVLVSVRDHISLARAIEKIINNNEMRVNMGISGRKFSEQEFDVNSIVNQHLVIYKALANTKTTSVFA